MSLRNKIVFTSGLLLVLIGLGAIDALTTVKEFPLSRLVATNVATTTETQEPIEPQEPSEPWPEDPNAGNSQEPQIPDLHIETSEPIQEESSSEESLEEPLQPDPTILEQQASSKAPETAEPVKKLDGPNVRAIIDATNFSYVESAEKTFLGQLHIDDKPIHNLALLKNGDRAGSITWLYSPKVKIGYLTLKEALHSAFTPQVKDLLDETQSPEGRPVRNILTFFDPGLSEERIVFIRVRESLYEFHIAEGSDDDIFILIDELTK